VSFSKRLPKWGRRATTADCQGLKVHCCQLSQGGSTGQTLTCVRHATDRWSNGHCLMPSKPSVTGFIIKIGIDRESWTVVRGHHIWACMGRQNSKAGAEPDKHCECLGLSSQSTKLHPLMKKRDNDPANPSSYRPISNLNTSARCLRDWLWSRSSLMC